MDVIKIFEILGAAIVFLFILGILVRVNWR
jgi:hypothetical protein